MRLNKRIAAAIAAVVLVALGVLGSTAFAAAPGQTATPGSQPAVAPRPVRVAGRVQSVTSSGLVLQVGKRTVNVNSGPNTWILVRENGRCTEAQLSQVQTGKAALVEGMATSAANTIDARVISQGACPAALLGTPARQLRHGTVKSISGGTLTLTTAAGRDLAINTTSQTVVLNGGFSTVSSIKVGDKVQVFGRAQAARRSGQTGAAAPSIVAYAIHDLASNTRVTLGRVSSVSANTITLGGAKNKAGRSVNVDSSTGYKTLTYSNGAFTLSASSLTDVKPGSNLLLEVSPAGSGGTSPTAEAVIILPGGKAPPTNP